MNDETRGRRTAAREEVQRAPRPGGRVAGQRSAAPSTGGRTTEGRITEGRPSMGRAPGVRGVTTAGRTAGGARGARRPPDRAAGPAAAVDGATALKLETVPQPVAEPRLRVAPPAPVRVPRARFVAAVVAVVVAGVFGILIINTKTNQNTFVIDDLRKQQAALADQEQQLDRQLDVLGSAGSLHAAANRLGLVASGTPAYIRLPDGKVLLVPKPGEGPQSRAYQEPPKQQGQGTPGQGTPDQGTPGQDPGAQVQQQGAGR